MSRWNRVTARFRRKPSPFLSLPPEIRHQIYLEVFGPENIHLVHYGSRVWHVRCSCSNSRYPAFNTSCLSAELACGVLRELASQQGNNTGPPASTDRPPKTSNRLRDSLSLKGPRTKPRTASPTTTSTLLYPLFLVNKQISAEAQSALYSGLLFRVEQLEALVHFARIVPTRNLASIRHLEACWYGLACLTQRPVPPSHPEYPRYEAYTVFSDDAYRDFWRIVARDMPGLTDLDFVMDFQGQYLSRAVDAKWHRPLQDVRGLKRLKVYVWDKVTGTEQAEEDIDKLREFLSMVCRDSREGGSVVKVGNGVV